MSSSANPLRDTLLTQLETAWALARYHLDGLTTEECLALPARVGLQVTQRPDGVWRGTWPESEQYSIGPASIAWLTWHLGAWWSMVQNHSFGDATLKMDDVNWPGSAEGVRTWLGALHDEWRSSVSSVSDAELGASERSRWPLQARPFADVVAWANLELMKNAAEIGYARFVLGAAAERARE